MYVVFKTDGTADTPAMEICPDTEMAKSNILAFLNEPGPMCTREEIDEYPDGRLHGWDPCSPREAYAFPLAVLNTALELLAEALDAVEADETARRESWPDEVARGDLQLNLGGRIREFLDRPIWRAAA